MTTSMLVLGTGFRSGAAVIGVCGAPDQLIARIRGEAEPPGYDGKGACWMELGNREVGRIEVDSFSTPGHPTGSFTEPSAETAAEKTAFGAERGVRWFGLDAR